MLQKIPTRLTVFRETLVDRLVHLLQESILSGNLKPETKLSEARVAKEFGVSRVPAREALQRLEEMNLIRKNHLGREVAKFSLEEFREIYELKNVVEAFGVMKGARRATGQDRTKIRSIIHSMQTLLQAKDLRKMKDLNLKFHDFLVHCSRSKMLIQLHDSLARQVRWASSKSFQFQNRPELSLQEHLAIFEAFEKGDGEKARVLMETHTNESMERTLSKFAIKESQSEIWKGEREEKKGPGEK